MAVADHLTVPDTTSRAVAPKTTSTAPPRFLRRHSVGLTLSAILLVAVLLRVIALDTIPPGLFHDEAMYAFDAYEVLTTDYRPPYFERNTGGREPLYIYLVAAAMALLGATEVTLRLVSATLGTLTVLATFLAGRRLFSPVTGLLAAGLLAGLPWHVHLSRDGFRAISLPLFTALAWWLIARAWDRRQPLDAVLAGVSTGLVFYTYLAGRLFPLAVGLWVLYLLILRPWGARPLALNFWTGTRREEPAPHAAREQTDSRRRIHPLVALALAGVVAVAVMTPLGVYYAGRPDIFFARLDQVGPGESVTLSRTVVADSLPKVLGMFSVAGDPNLRHNIAARPVFDPVVSLFFYAGIVLCLLHLRRPAAAAVLIWAGALLLPTALSSEAPHYLRASGALPALVLLPAVAATWLLRRLQGGWRVAARTFFAAGLLLIGASTATAYFGSFGRSVEAAEAYGTAVEAACRAAATLPESEAILFSESLYRHATCRFLARNEPAFRWFDGEQSLVLPAPDGRPVNVVAPRDTLAPEFAQLLAQAATTESGAAGPLLPAYTRFRLDSAAYARLQQSVEPATAARQVTGDRIALRGYSLDRGGETQVVYVYWDVLASSANGLDNTTAFSVRLVDTSGTVWDQRDGLGYLDPEWRAGDRVISRFPLRLPDDAPPGEYHPEVVVYEQDTKQPWPVSGPPGSPPDRARFPTFYWPAGRAADPARLPQPERPIEQTIQPGLHLRGFDVPPAVRAGETLPVTWHWLLSAPGGERGLGPIAVGFEPVGGPDAVRWQTVRPLPDPGAAGWVAGQAVRHRTPVPVDLNLPPGRYRLLVAAEVGSAEAIDAGPLDITGRERAYEAPAYERLIGATLPELGELLGVSLEPSSPAPGTDLTVRLVWRASAASDHPLAIFVHLLDGEGRVVAQHDGPPGRGEAPTTTWLPSEFVTDPHTIALPPDLAPGTYRIVAGLYDPRTGERRQTASSTDRINIGEVVIGAR